MRIKEYKCSSLCFINEGTQKQNKQLKTLSKADKELKETQGFRKQRKTIKEI